MKKRKFAEKKALSPVIATVLLISLAIILAIIIFLWARGFIKEIVEKEVGGVKKSADKFCPDILMQASISGSDLIVSNMGNIPIYKLSVKKQTMGSSDLQELQIDLVPGETSEKLDLGGIASYETILLIPVILGKSGEEIKEYTCSADYAIECAGQADGSFAC